MTSLNSTDVNEHRHDREAETPQRISLSNDRWVPHENLTIPVDDIGFRQGVIAVERLRTYRRKIFCLDAHLGRWRTTLESLAITETPSEDDLKKYLATLLERNQSWIEREQEVGITMVATPGLVRQKGETATPTFLLHLNPLDHDGIRQRQEHGQPLRISSITQPAPSCWPRNIKVRSRIHYYLADSAARHFDTHSLGVLLDTDGSITETSVCNLAIVTGGRIVSPPDERVLPGVTQAVIERCAEQASLQWVKRPVLPAELSRAAEILLMGTDTGLWYASRIDGKSIGKGQPGPVYLQLRRRFQAIAAG